jgi:hypothetical protein
MGTGGFIPGDNAARAWILPLASILYRGKEWWSYTFTSPYVFTPYCLINEAQGRYLTYQIINWLTNLFTHSIVEEFHWKFIVTQLDNKFSAVMEL